MFFLVPVGAALDLLVDIGLDEEARRVVDGIGEDSGEREGTGGKAGEALDSGEIVYSLSMSGVDNDVSCFDCVGAGLGSSHSPQASISGNNDSTGPRSLNSSDGMTGLLSK